MQIVSVSQLFLRQSKQCEKVAAGDGCGHLKTLAEGPGKPRNRARQAPSKEISRRQSELPTSGPELAFGELAQDTPVFSRLWLYFHCA